MGVVLVADGPSQLTLVPNGTETISLEAGDRWQGVYRFDAVTVRGNAAARSNDPLRAGSTSVEPGSSLITPDVDTTLKVTITAPLAGAAFVSGDTIAVAFTSSDDVDVTDVVLKIGEGAAVTVSNPNATASANLPVPEVLSSQSVTLEARAHDAAGHEAVASVPLTFNPDPPPTLAIVSPSEGATVTASQPFSLEFTWSDNRPGVTATYRLGGGAEVAIPTNFGSPITLTVSAPATTGSTTITVTVTDIGGHSTSDTRNIVVAGDQPPTITLTELLPESITAGQTLSVCWRAEDDLGITRVVTTVSGLEPQTTDVGGYVTAQGSDYFEIPVSNPPASVQVVVTATDTLGQPSSTLPVTVAIVPDALPGVTILDVTPSEWRAGDTLEIQLRGTDDTGLRRIRFEATSGGEGIDEMERDLSAGVEILPTDDIETFEWTVPHGISGDIVLTAWTEDEQHQWSDPPATTTVQMAPDTLAPILSYPYPDRPVFSGETVSVGADANDDSGGDLGWTYTIGGEPADQATADSYVVPDVAAASEIPVHLEAADAAGHVGKIDFAITAHPVADSPILLNFIPADGALVPPGTEVWISGEAYGAPGMEKIEFFRDADAVPFETITNPSAAWFGVQFTVPELPEGSMVSIRLKGTDTAGRTRELVHAWTVVVGVSPPDGTTIAAGDTTYDGATLVVRNGTVAIEGDHTFSRLVVFSRLVPPQDGEITVTGDAYVYGLVDANQLGYAGGATYPGTTGSVAGAGGSHAGSGSGDGAGAIYGSVAEPSDAGAGGGECVGGGCAGGAGGAGGGIIRLTAHRLLIDGGLEANGEYGYGGEDGGGSGGGAGGSIRIAAATLEGSGWLTAGGAEGARPGGAGGGGRIAILADASSFTLGWTKCTGSGAWSSGSAPGTLFLKGPGDSHGRLIVDNGYENESGKVTELISIGTGTVGSVSGTTLTDPAASFRRGVEGLTVEVVRGGSPVGRYRVVTNPSATSLQLESAASGNIQIGDTYRGVQTFNQIILRNGAHVVTSDVLEGPVTADSTSTLVTP
jgi:hypothetical protein